MAEKQMISGGKLDLAKERPEYYRATKTPQLVKLKPAKYLAIEGAGSPESAEFQAAIRAMYSVAFTVKMTRKFEGTDYKVCHLEGLWWSDRDRPKPAELEAFLTVSREVWRWKLLIMVPDFIKESEVEQARSRLVEKTGDDTVQRVRLEKIDEGLCVQILHVGPYATSSESILEMRGFMREQGLKPHGLHHEIFLSDPWRVRPEKIRTILRHPVVKV